MRKSVSILGLLILAASIAGLVLWPGIQTQSADEVEGAPEIEGAPLLDLTSENGGLPEGMRGSSDDLGGEATSQAISYRDAIRQRVAASSRRMNLPPPPAMRSPSGEIDPLQCERSSSTCQYFSPMSAKSWDDAQWMRRHGFLDAAQLAEAERWSDAELDTRVKFGDPAAVAELARRFLENGDELYAREVLMDAVRRGNVYAAHRLAAIDNGRSFPFHTRPGLEWLLVARRMGDTEVTMTYIASQYDQLQPRELDHAMLIADRWAERLNLHSRPLQRRPER